jgi:thermitase
VYEGEAGVEYVEPDYAVSAVPLIGLTIPDSPNDYFFYDQWALNNTGQEVPGQPAGSGTIGTPDADIDALEAWTITQGSSAVLIAILDTGIDQDHEDLVGKIKVSKNFTDSATIDDIAGHGTHVAGITAAYTNNAKGVAGIATNSLLLNGKVLNDSGSGYNSWIANGIIWAADQGAKVINLSLGGSGKSTVVSSAVDYAWSKGAVIVAAAGNNGNSSPFYPAYYSNCIAVAATDQNDARAYFSNYGNWVDIAAPGVNIISSYPAHPNTNVYLYASGTSMASPQVAGVAALVWASEYGTSNSSVRSRLQGTADPISGTGTYWQNGRVNAYNAVQPTVPNAPPSAVDDAYSTAEDVVFSIAAPGILSNDSDKDGDPLTASRVSGPANGTLTLNANGGFTYAPALNFNGSDSFTYKAYDGKAYSNVATVTLTVNAVNDPPVITSTPVTTASVGVPYVYDVNATDPDIGDTLIFSLITSPNRMSINPASGLISWTPESAETFPVTVQVTDGKAPVTQEFSIIVSSTPVESVLFSDNFEDGTLGKWVQDSQNDWFNSTQRGSSRSAEVDGSATDATLAMKDAINLAGKTSATLSFSWFIESNWDSGEYIKLDLFYSGAWHTTTYSINGARNTGAQEDKWINVSILLGSSNLASDFKIRFRAKVSDSVEDGNIDNVKLVAR